MTPNSANDTQDQQLTPENVVMAEPAECSRTRDWLTAALSERPSLVKSLTNLLNSVTAMRATHLGRGRLGTIAVNKAERVNIEKGKVALGRKFKEVRRRSEAFE